MRWLLYLVAALAALFAVVAAVGAALPAEHRVSRSLRLRQSPSNIWQALDDLSGQAEWRTDLASIELLPDRAGRRAWREHWKNGQQILMEESSRTPPSRLVTRIADESLPFGGTWTFEIDADGDGSRVRITEDGVVRNVIFRSMAKFVFGHSATMEGYLKSLAGKFGEPSAAISE